MNRCKIVEDLLPLYAEELVSEESKAYIDRHTADCPRCAKLLERAKLPVAEPEEDPEQLKKNLRRDKLKIMAKGTVTFLLIMSLITALMVGIGLFVLWRQGATPVEAVFESPMGLKTITVVDWDRTGYFMKGKGSAVWTESREYEGPSGNSLGGVSMSNGMDLKPWENIHGYWAPDGWNFLAVVELVEGGEGMFIDTGTGSSEDPYRWEGRLQEHGILGIVKAQCFPTVPWEDLRFTFYAWGTDSETVTLIYETADGQRGFVDYHFPSETVVNMT